MHDSFLNFLIYAVSCIWTAYQAQEMPVDDLEYKFYINFTKKHKL